MSILARLPWNSQVKMAKRPSIEKSAWLMPAHCGTASDDCSAIVCGSRKSSRLSASATTMAELPVGREVHVVRVVDGDGLARLARRGIDRRQAAVGAPLGVVGHPERLQVPRRHDVLRVDADPEPVDHLERGGIDHVDVVGLQVRHVDARQRARHRRAQLARPRLAVEVRGVRHGRHARHRLDGPPARLGRGGAERQRPQESSHHTETPPSPRARREPHHVLLRPRHGRVHLQSVRVRRGSVTDARSTSGSPRPSAARSPPRRAARARAPRGSDPRRRRHRPRRDRCPAAADRAARAADRAPA